MNGMATWGDKGRYEGKDADSHQDGERLRFSVRERKRRPVDDEDRKRYDAKDGCGVGTSLLTTRDSPKGQHGRRV